MDSSHDEHRESADAKAQPTDAGESTPQDPWASLTDSLGIEAKPEPDPKQPPAAVPVPPRPVVEHEPPTRQPSGWGDLASQLGLEAKEEPAATEEKQAEKPKAPKAKPPKVVPAPPEPADVEVVEEVAEVVIDEGPEWTDAEQQVEVDAAPVAEPPAPSGFSAGGLTLPDWFPFGGRKKSPPTPPPAPEPEPAEEPVAEDETETETLEAEATSAEDAETTPAGDAEQPEKRRGRRRRGRRRGRGRGKEGDESDASGEESSAKVSDSELPESVTDSDDEEDEETQARRISHKNIPAWQEAIGVVVDANIAARGERKRNSRGRGNPRGNTRGGRGRRRGGSPKKEG